MVVLLQLSGMAVAEEIDSCAGLGVTPYADQSDPNIAIGRQTPDTISSLTATITHDPGNPNIITMTPSPVVSTYRVDTLCEDVAGKPRRAAIMGAMLVQGRGSPVGWRRGVVRSRSRV